MSTRRQKAAAFQDDLSEEKEVLLKKLATVFDPATALDFVSPKTSETRHHSTIEELLNLNYDQPKKHLLRLRSMDHYQTTTQSLSRADLEASYQAFVRDQVGRQCARNELEEFVRNSSDIDDAQRFLDSAPDIRTNPPQSQLLFRSSKLNEEKAHLLQATNPSKSLRELNDDSSIQKYFLEPFAPEPRDPVKEAADVNAEKKLPDAPPPLLQVEQGEKRYRITFVKDSDAFRLLDDPSHYASDEHAPRPLKTRNLESLLSADTSTVHGRSSVSHTTSIHREIFPPLSLSALKEYRPTIAASPLSASTANQTAQQSRQALYKPDFIWEQSIVSPKDD